MYKRLRSRLFDLLEAAPPDDRASRAVDIGLMILITANVVFVILGSIPRISEAFAGVLRFLEVVSVGVFTVEYIARLWACAESNRYADGWQGRIRFATSPLMLVDLAAIVPFYAPMLIAADLRVLRALRLFRLMRVFKLVRYVPTLRMFGAVIKAKKEELLVVAFAMGLMSVLTSSVLYFVEHEAQPEVFSSIPTAMWWGIATLTTVGYNHMFPITTVGKFCGILMTLIDIAMFAIPAGLLASGFVEETQRRARARQPICPHCGRLADANAPHDHSQPRPTSPQGEKKEESEQPVISC